MLSRLLTGGEETQSILILASQTSDLYVARKLAEIILNSLVKKQHCVLIKTGAAHLEEEEFREIVDYSDCQGWISGTPLQFPQYFLDKVKLSETSVVVDSLTDLITFYSHHQVTNFVRKFRKESSKQSKLVGILSKICVDNIDDLQKFFTTVIEVSDNRTVTAREKLCRIKHLKAGGKLVTSREVLKFDDNWTLKIVPFKEEVKKQVDEADEVVDNLTTFNLGTTKDKEKQAKDNLVLPFYKEPQKIGEVKLQKGDTNTSVEQSKIYYEPDSGDDWDDEDPDDDLDF